MKLQFSVLAVLIILLCFPASKENNYFNWPAKNVHSSIRSSNESDKAKVVHWTLFSAVESLKRTFPVFRSTPYSVAFKQSVKLAGYHDHLYVSAYSQYCFLFKTQSIPKWEGVLIYPFHYFW